ncbi:MAG: SGNH/GDSL hydrolase family protein [Anaerolineae bacterium]|nr:SGNH/GDSL hydrolase family protein [Anaerolineae bacterium]
MMVNRVLRLVCRLVLVMVAGTTIVAQEETPVPTPDLTPPTFGDFDPDSVADIDLEDYPVLPAVTAHARAIYAAGLEARNDPRIFVKVGDCMTVAPEFLTMCGPDIDFGEYTDLQEVVEHFAGAPARGGAQDWELDSFADPGLASASGYNTTSVLDPLWADPTWCKSNEGPLACAYRSSQPGFAVIMFGTNDVQALEPDYFDYYLRLIVLETIERGVVPVLNTFPGRPELPEKSARFNQIIVKIATDYDLPLINLWLALQDLPDGGINMDETIHLTAPADGRWCDFTEANLQAGYTMRNLVTLQALDVLWRGLDEEG